MDAIILHTKHEIIHIIPDAKLRYGNVKKISKVFSSDVHIGLTLNILNLPRTFVNWGKSLVSGTSKTYYPTLKSGYVTVAGRLGNDWAGMRIEKKE